MPKQSKANQAPIMVGDARRAIREQGKKRPKAAVGFEFNIEQWLRYDPDKDLEEASRPKQIILDLNDYSAKDRNKDGTGRNIEVDATLMEYSPLRRGDWVLRRYRSKRQLFERIEGLAKRIRDTQAALRESSDAQVRRLSEQFELDDVFSGAYFGGAAGIAPFTRVATSPAGGWLNCLDGETLIPLLDGSTVTVKDLAARWQARQLDAWVYSYDVEKERVVPGRVSVAAPSGTKLCVEVTIDTGDSVIASTDHPFLLRNGEYRKAGDLKPGDRLMPLYRRNRGGYEKVWHPQLRLEEDTHRMVARNLWPDEYFAYAGGKPNSKIHVHHKGRRSNNDPSNLEVLTNVAHGRKTALAQTAAGKWTPELRQRQRESALRRWANLDPVTSAARRKQAREAAARLVADPEVRRKLSERMRRFHADPERIAAVKRANAVRRGRTNHRVVSVAVVGERPVYDLQVEKWQNLALAIGVFTHNSEYIPLMVGPFTRNLYLYDLLDMHRKAFWAWNHNPLAKQIVSITCLAGDTRIPLLDGTSPTIREMAEQENQGWWVYAFDGKCIAPARAEWAKKTGKGPTVEVALDNGETVTCTPNHPFMLRDGEWRNAGDLKPGDRIMPLYRRVRGRKGYEWVYHPAMDLWEPTHHLVARKVLPESFGALERAVGGRHIHHRNENRFDNTPENLEILSKSAHLLITARSESKRAATREQMRARRRDPSYNAKLRERIGSSENRKRHAEIMRQRWADPEYRQNRLEGLRSRWNDPMERLAASERAKSRERDQDGKWLNHVVASVRPGPIQDVYDLCVPPDHNFAVAAGVIVHNTTFVVGKGVTAAAKSDRAQAAWDAFASDNDLYRRLRTWSDELSIFGELMLWWKIDPYTGRVKVRSLDPATCWEVITEPSDIDKVYAYHFQYPCLVGSTRIATLDGAEPTIAEMAQRHAAGEEMWVYSFDRDKGMMVPGKVSAAFATGEKECVEIELDNGEKVIASTDHPFMRFDGRYTNAADLKPGDRLMPLYRKFNRRGRNQYECVYQPWFGDWEFTHSMVAREAHRDSWLDIPADIRLVHHVDRRTTNNLPTNLEVMTRKEHGEAHRGEASRNMRQMRADGRWLVTPKGHGVRVWADPSNRARMQMGIRAAWADSESRTDRIASIVRGWAGSKRRNRNGAAWADPDKKARWVESIRASWRDPQKRANRLRWRGNHTVVAARPAGRHLVYDLTVDRTHNFALAAGAVVSNTQYQIYTVPNVPYTRYILKQIPANEILHARVNVTSGEKRGRSDLIPVLGWLKRVIDFYNAMVIRAQMTASMVWDDTVKGSDKDVTTHASFVQSNPPSAGEVFVHNEAITRQLLGGGGQRGPSMDPIGEALMNLVGVGAGIPKEYLGVSTHGARATALVATEPAAKKFEDRQLTIEWILTQLSRRVFAAAGLPKSEWDIEFTFPSIATEDRSAKIKDVVLSESAGYLSHQTGATIVGKELGITTFDYKNEMDQIRREIGEDPAKVTSGLYPMINKLVTAKGVPGTGGVPEAPGQRSEAPASPGAAGGAPPAERPKGEDGPTILPEKPEGRPAGSSGRMGHADRVHQNPATTTGRGEMKRDIMRKEAEGLSEAGGAIGSSLIVVRHGETDSNRGGGSRDLIRGWANVPLNDEGRYEMEALADKLRDEGVRARWIFTSDLARCVQSAEIIAKHQDPGAQVVPVEALRSWGVGGLEGRQATPDVVEEIKRLVKNDTEMPPPEGGETFRDFKRRVTGFFRETLERLGDSNQTVVAVTHARDIQLLDLWLQAGADVDVMSDQFAEDLAMEPDTVRPAGYIRVAMVGGRWQVVERWRDQRQQSMDSQQREAAKAAPKAPRRGSRATGRGGAAGSRGR